MPRHRAEHLLLVAVVGIEEVSANKKKYDVVGLDVPVNLLAKVPARSNAAIVPCLDNALPLKQRELLLELVA
jgi:hypothetical protein